MRIGIDIRSLGEKQYTGVSVYTLELLKALFKIDRENEYVLFYNSFSKQCDERINNTYRKYWTNRNISARGCRIPNKILNASATFLNWPKIDRMAGRDARPMLSGADKFEGKSLSPFYKRGNKKIDLFFSPNFLFSSFSKECKKVLTVHDLSFQRCPQFYNLKGRLWHKFVKTREMCENSDLIIAVSDNTKYDIMELYHIPEEKIRVIYPGIGSSGSDKTGRTYRPYHLPKKYILFLGTVEKRKNVKGVIDAFRLLNEEYGICDYDLVVAGKLRNKEIEKLEIFPFRRGSAFGGRNSTPAMKAWQELEIRNKIKLIGYADEETKDCLYRNADIFVYPSFYEGFGFPPLEAMANGIPVITSNSSSIPEVIGDAGILVDPHNSRDIARAIAEVLKDEKLRNSIIEKGYERAKMFSWEKCAREVLEIFNTVVYGHHIMTSHSINCKNRDPLVFRE